MRLFFQILVFLIPCPICFGQGPKVEVKFSEPLAIYFYVQNLSSKSTDNAFKKQFLGSVYNREKYKTLVSQFDTLKLNYTYSFDGFPYGSKTPGSTEALLKRNLANSVNLKEFKKNALGLIPNVTLLQLTAILYEFQLVYRELVYQPNKVRFEKQLAEISELVKSKKLSAHFDKGSVLFKSYWDESFSLQLLFYPASNVKEFPMEAFSNNATGALSPDTKDYSTIVSDVMCEAFCVLYDEQSQLIKRNIKKWFDQNSSKCSAYAALLLNEVLATAMGNGYVGEMLVGKTSEEDWNDRKYVNLMAKKIYPMVADYVAQKKGIDEGFINIYIKFYEDNYTDWLNELDNLMCYRHVISDNLADFSLVKKLYSNNSLSQYDEGVTEASLEKIKSSPVTKVIVVSKENELKLSMIKKKFPELKDWKYKAKQDFFFNFFLADKTQLIVVNTLKNTTEQMLNGRITLPPAIEGVKK